MADLLVRDLDQDLVQRLEKRAAAHGRSPEEEHRAILSETLGAGESAPRSKDEVLAQLAELRARTAGRYHTPSEVLMREGRDER